METCLIDHISANGIRLRYFRWGDPAAGKPAAVLVHGTGFCAATWRAVAESLAADFTVYAYDRRGHGGSTAPEAGYELLDFAEDLAAFLDALELRDVYGIGHSAGGADVLLAAAQRPNAFSRIFCHEPPVSDPAAEPGGPGLTEEDRLRLQERANRRAEFLTREDVLARYGSRPPFDAWRADMLQEYIEHGFVEGRDGIVRLCCQPDTEVRMLLPITNAVKYRHWGEGRPNPFAELARYAGPIAASTSGNSRAEYHRGAQILGQVYPHLHRVEFPDSDHCIPQENPDALAAALQAFARRA